MSWEPEWLKPIVRGVKSVFDLAILPKLRESKRQLDQLHNLERVAEEVATRKGRGIIRCNQNPLEIKALVNLLASKRLQTIVEIGTSKGGTLYLWTRLVQPGGLVISIDLPGEIGSVRPVHLSVYRTFGQERNVEVQTLALDSHAPETIDMLRQILGDRTVDFLFIDGDHSYAGVKSDFFDYLPLMSPRGIVGMHDIAVSDRVLHKDVDQFWAELEGPGLQKQSFIAPRGFGIGVVELQPGIAGQIKLSA